MDFFEVVKKRRSVRRYKNDPFPDEFVRRALEAATLAPNSSNVQTWDFHWVKRTSPLWESLVKACFSQSAARTANQLVVVTTDAKLWRRSKAPLVDYVKSTKAPKQVLLYYEKLVPFMYTWGPLSSLGILKWIAATTAGLFKPMARGPFSKLEIQAVTNKSAALAAENFALAITAQGGATCMMEGFDEWRVKRLLKLSRSARVTMVISVGFEGDNGIWGPQFRLPFEKVVHVHD